MPKYDTKESELERCRAFFSKDYNAEINDKDISLMEEEKLDFLVKVNSEDSGSFIMKFQSHRPINQ